MENNLGKNISLNGIDPFSDEVFNSIQGYSTLTKEQKELFKRIHKRHMSAFGSDKQIQYASVNIRKITWDTKENCLKVYYDDNWWHYDTKGDWF